MINVVQSIVLKVKQLYFLLKLFNGEREGGRKRDRDRKERDGKRK